MKEWEYINQLQAEVARLRAALEEAKRKLRNHFCDDGEWSHSGAMLVVKEIEAALANEQSTPSGGWRDGKYVADYGTIKENEQEASGHYGKPPWWDDLHPGEEWNPR